MIKKRKLKLKEAAVRFNFYEGKKIKKIIHGDA